jgi:hypothetical protein
MLHFWREFAKNRQQFAFSGFLSRILTRKLLFLVRISGKSLAFPFFGRETDKNCQHAGFSDQNLELLTRKRRFLVRIRDSS